jgi:hypothetical protein
VYRQKLDDARAWVSVFAHGYPFGQSFIYPGGADMYWAHEYTSQDPPANFYNHFTCSFCRYTETLYACGGVTSVFNESHGLCAIGSTKTGSMLEFGEFYRPMAEGKTIGQAYMDWFNFIAEGGFTHAELCWYYGMTLLGDPFLRPVLQADVCPTAVICPERYYAQCEAVVPQVRVWNAGKGNASFAVTCSMRLNGQPYYASSESVSGLGVGAKTTVDLDSVFLDSGRYTVRVRTTMSGDENPLNDTFVSSVTVAAKGWEAGPDVPFSAKPVKDGGWLAYDAGAMDGTGLIFASCGNKQSDFCSYDLVGNVWVGLAPWQIGTDGKMPSKGSAGCADGNGVIYATKGNNKSGFWKYTAGTNAWTQLEDVPLGPSKKKVKGGTGIAWAYKDGVGSPYLLKGYKNEFYRYDVSTDTWLPLPDAPIGGNQKWDKGSWLVSDGAHTLYAAKAKYDEFYSYNTETDSWSGPLTGMPPSGSGGNKKQKDGSCGAYSGSCVYALKGGNTQEFWRYTAATDSWHEMDTLPRVGTGGKKKKVKAGGSVTSDGSVLYALKGNKCNEFWRYVPGQPGGVDAEMQHASGGGSGRDDGESPVMEGIEAYGPRWRSDGQAVIVSHENSIGYLQIYEVSYSGGIGTETRVVEVAADCEEPSYSRQGDRVCFTIDTAGFQIAVVDLDTSYGREGMDGTEASAAPALAVSSTGTTPGPRAFGDISIITSSPYDHTSPSFSPSDDQICYARESDDGDDDIWRIPANGGDEEQLTACNSSHESPVWLSDNEVAFIHVPDDDFDQVAKVVISNSTEMDLTWSEYDHARPDATESGTALCFEVFDDDGAQVARVCSDGGDETVLTTGNRDMEAPDWANSSSIFCARWTGITSAICRVDAINGGYTAITDSSAIRDNPDGWDDHNGSTSYVIFERESWDPLDLFGDGGRKKKWGTGVFLKRYRQPHDGAMGAGLYAFALERAKPNPARSRATISWQVPVLSDVSLRVYNTAGQLVKVLVDGKTKPGAYTSVWNGTDTRGRRLASGVYFYALDSGSKRISRKLVLTD